MAIEVFNRCEKKYMLNKEKYQKITERMQDYMLLDAYNENKEFYQISNIYYDTLDDRLIRASIEKPVYKEKLRLRSYGTPELKDKVFVEIKKKYNGIVNKRRTSMHLQEAYDYLNNDVYPAVKSHHINEQVLREIDYFRNFYDLMPKVYLSYDRKAYFEKNNGDFRVTFDKNITARRYDLQLEKGSYGELLLKEDVYLMEIKINRAVPLWFTKMLSELEIYPVSFSKYGTEYKNYVINQYNSRLEKSRNEVRGEKICLNQYLQAQQIIPSVLAHHC